MRLLLAGICRKRTKGFRNPAQDIVVGTEFGISLFQHMECGNVFLNTGAKGRNFRIFAALPAKAPHFSGENPEERTVECLQSCGKCEKRVFFARIVQFVKSKKKRSEKSAETENFPEIFCIKS